MFTSKSANRPLFVLTIIAIVIIILSASRLLSDHPAPKPQLPRPAEAVIIDQPELAPKPQVPVKPATPVVRQTAKGKQLELCGELASCFTPLRDILSQRGITPASIELEVDKSDRLLRLIVNGESVKTYVIGLGKNPEADKTRRGDKATPEGDYYVCQKLPQSRFYLSLKVSYPNISDAERGLKCGLIDKSTYNKIVSAISARKIPPMNTKLGGDICIHGGGAGSVQSAGDTMLFNVRDWTAGCMALDNPQMKELFEFIPVGTPVRIRA